MAPTDKEEAWVFRFVVESASGRLVAQEEADALLDHIIAWVERHELQIGGGYRVPGESDEVL